MKNKNSKLNAVPHFNSLFGALGAPLMFIASAHLEAATTFHVRPYTVVIPVAISDGLSENNQTSKSLYFSDSSKTAEASANLETGELKAYAGINNSIAGSSAMAEFSDTFTIRSGANTTFDFNFNFDGILNTDAKSVPEGSIYQISLTANFAVFKGGEADWNTWWNKAYLNGGDGSALEAETFTFNADNPAEDIANMMFEESFAFNTVLNSDFEQFHVFSRIQMLVNATGAPQTAEFNFLNTGTLGFTADRGVEVSSASGVFPGTQRGPSVPDGGTTLALLCISLGGLAWGRRKLS